MESSDQNKAETAKVRINALAHGGSCIGEIIDNETGLAGIKVFVPETIPGEKVEVALLKKHETFYQGQLLKILTPSEDRIEPACPYFTSCGGCDLQHMTVLAQRKAKQDMVSTMVKHHAGTEPTNGVSLLGEDLPDFHYRRRITLHMRAGKVGFYRKNTADTVEIDKCLISEDVVNQELAKLLPILKSHRSIRGDLIIEQHHGEAYVIIRMLVKYRKDKVSQFPEELLAELKAKIANIKVHLSKHTYLHQINFKDVSQAEPASLPIGHFSQVNDQANEYLLNTVLDNIDRDVVTELYAGSGNFSLALAKQGKKVDAVEVDKKLVKYGKALAKAEYLDKLVEFYRMTSEHYVEKHQIKECLILDPPRSGAAFAAESMGRHTNTKKIVYISCYMPTLSRDIKTLVGHGFELEDLYVVDMFPQTHHVETISILTRT
ncbi:MAG: 23S rRNA (uracil(1939)-C(5))-methyltransferase RlmD [Bdellovibrionota bacterium]